MKVHELSSQSAAGRGHKIVLEKEIILNMRLNFFTQKTVNDWNSLSREATTAKDVNQFKNHIDYLFQSECNAGGLYMVRFAKT